jgi:hypothetical protein
VSNLAAVEAFHLAFLRAFGRTMPPDVYALKGGTNLRWFFGSIRYSEDIGLDVRGPPVFKVRDAVDGILRSTHLLGALRPVGVESIRPQDPSTAKQTETVQRFKVHLLTAAGEDVATKIEMSRRGLDAPIRAESVDPAILREYRMPPLIAPHYAAVAAARQKLRALAGRSKPEARDVFDLYILHTHLDPKVDDPTSGLSRGTLERARERTYDIEYGEYRDKVVTFLKPDEQAHHDRPEMWDEIRLLVVSLIERGARGEGD